MFASTGINWSSGQNSHLTFTSVSSYADARQLQKFVTAVKEEDIKTMRKILKKGVDVNIDLRFESGMEKMTALHFAALKGLVLAVREILLAKCDLNKETPFDMSTPLHCACQFEDTEASSAIIRDLLMHGANPNLTDHSGRTALYIAVLHGSLDVVKLLLRYGADSSIICKSEEYPDAIRHMCKHLDLMNSELQEMYDPYQGNSPLIQACREHFVDIAKELLKSDCEINYCNAAGNSALHVAAKSESRGTYLDRKMTRFPVTGNLEIVELLIGAGCSMDMRNMQGDTPIKRASDGISEIFAWSFPKEDKIENAKIFCDIVSGLITAGCRLGLLYNNATILSVLLRACPCVRQADSNSLLNKFVLCILHFLAAGVRISSEDLTKIQGLRANSAMLAYALQEAGQRPSSLKQLCKLTLRKHMRLPMRKNIMRLGVPRSLKDFISLETSI